jgi:cytochrome c oxidase assembly protein subunit 15
MPTKITERIGNHDLFALKIAYFCSMEVSLAFRRFSWITLVLIYLIVVAGSFVRITGSGMGCPDWPRCFDQWIPPTEEAQLPENYREKYAEYRAQKIEKFSAFLERMGMGETATALKNDPTLRVEEAFNARKTWTEYVNRLVGFLAGNAMLISFIWLLWKYRKRKLIFIAGLNLVLMAVEAWFGSIVVASNLVPWTITVHMLLALVIIGLQLLFIHQISPHTKEPYRFGRWMYIFLWFCFLVTFYQMFLGTQVREAIDELTKAGLERHEWIEQLGLPFYIHRSFSWLVLVVLTWMAWRNEKGDKISPIRWVYALLAVELLSGVLLAYADMPGLVQTSHLIFAVTIFGILAWMLLRSGSAIKVTQ